MIGAVTGNFALKLFGYWLFCYLKTLLQLTWKFLWMWSTWKKVPYIVWIAGAWDSKRISPKYKAKALRLRQSPQFASVHICRTAGGGGVQRNEIPSLLCTRKPGLLSVRRLGYGLWDWGIFVRFPTGISYFLFSKTLGTALGPTHPPIQCISVVPSRRIKLPRREATHSPPPTTEVRNLRSYTSKPHMPSCHAREFTFYHCAVLFNQ
jgi:hypothetical protein